MSHGSREAAPLDDATAFWTTLEKEVVALVDGEPDLVANCANVASHVYWELNRLKVHSNPVVEGSPVNWVGFYFVRGNELVLGPFMGRPACIRIAKGKGVCGTAWKEEKTQRVHNVKLLQNYIACAGSTQSEIVVPIQDEKKRIVAVFDLDCELIGGFNEEDEKGLIKICESLAKLGWEQLESPTPK